MTHKPAKRITLSDIAKAANVSIATASMAFSGKGRVSEKVTLKIHQLAKELGYQGKSTQVRPLSAKTKSISLLLLTDKKWAYLWYMEQRIVRELEILLARQNFTLILVPITEEDSNKRIIEKVAASGSCGVFSIHYGNPKLFSEFEKHRIPVTLIMNSDYQGVVHSICVDDFHGAYAATKHLIERGHYNIAFAEYKVSPVSSIMQDRFIGFEKAMLENNLKLQIEQHLHLDIHDSENITRQLESIFNRKNRPTAIFTVDDYIAAHVFPVLRRLNISIPDDISIIAPGDVIDYDVAYMPKITTMSINFEQMARLAVDMLMDLLYENENQIPSLKVELKLIDRGSTAFSYAATKP